MEKSIPEPITMRLVNSGEYQEYVREHPDMESLIQGKPRNRKVGGFGPSMEYEVESTTVWSFPDRGNWANHDGKYRGNWSPYVPRNLILKYTEEGDTVLDQMCGSGTTGIECKLLNRNCVCMDVNPSAAMLAFGKVEATGNPNGCWNKTYVGDARQLNEIADNSIDLIATHPPYAGIIPYSRRDVDGDLSALSVTKYLGEMDQVVREALRVLKPGKYCAVLMGDTRKGRHYVPIAFNVMRIFLQEGFILKEDIIKLQWKMKGTRERWRGKSYDFYKIAHEHLFVFRKLSEGEDEKRYRGSSEWIMEIGRKPGGNRETL